MSPEKLKGYTEEDFERITAHIEKLMPHLAPDEAVFVGGLAVNYWLQKSGIELQIKPFNDLDLVVEKFSTVKPSICNDFLVYHIHKDSNSFYFAFVDPKTRTKVDIFDSSSPVLVKSEIKVGNNRIQIISPENQLVTLIPTVLLASNDLKRDPKLIDEINLLASISNMDIAQGLWEKMSKRGSVEEGIERVNGFMKQNPEFFQEKPYHKAGPYRCKNCVQDSDFPLTPMEQIYDVLGYVE